MNKEVNEMILQALREQSGLQWAVLVVRVESWKLVQVLTLGTHLFALKGDDHKP